MRIFHLSDLHIGIRLYNYDLREEQEYIFNEIIEKMQEYKPDVIVIAGDIYDRAMPSGDAIEMFDRFINKIRGTDSSIIIMMISGNHDSRQRIGCYGEILEKQGLYMVGIPPRTQEDYIKKVTLQDSFGNVNFYLLPYVSTADIKGVLGYNMEQKISYNEAVHKLIEREDIDESQRNIIVSHQFYIPTGKDAKNIERTESEVKTAGNIDYVNADVLEKFDYSALGHIHKPMKVGSETIRYCGTPMAYSVSEAGQKKGILMVDIGEKEAEVEVTNLPLTPMRNVRIIEGKFEELIKEHSDDFVTIVLTDTEEIEALDMQERLKIAFPKLLEIRRNNVSRIDNELEIETEDTLKSPYELICKFIPSLKDDEKELIKNVINEVMLKEGE